MNIIFLGPPGSGKGTQSDIIKDKFNIIKVSTGDMLRNEIKESSTLGMEIKSKLENGELIPDQVMISIIENFLTSKISKKGFILDGFPRTLNQAISLSEIFKRNGTVLNAVIELKVDEEILLERVAGRFICTDCNASYNSKFNPTISKGICDKCHSNNFSFRNDDNIDTLKSRIKTYYDQAVEIISYYKSLNLLHTIDGTKEVTDITHDINLILRL